jgi:hypothetical protein
MIFTVNKLPKNNDWAAANAIGPFIFVKKEYRNNAGLIAHEKFHVKWFWIASAITFAILFGLLHSGVVEFHPFYLILSFITKPLAYFVKPLKFHEEAAAYAIQHNINNEDDRKLEFYALILSKHYNLNVTQEKSLALIKKYKEKFSK